MSACAGEDPELWFMTHPNTQRRAKEICGRCPIQQDCLTHALEHKIDYGIWGGLSPAERYHLVRRRREKARSIHPAPPPSEVRGVSWDAEEGRWAVAIRYKGEQTFHGHFDDQQMAEAVAQEELRNLGLDWRRRHDKPVSA